ncbi:MAG TPA: hypothetical protein VFA27_03010 [Vicinamibacterales bacterium]|nr:hypothetical protein [Vicinamibacterales bacterium]
MTPTKRRCGDAGAALVAAVLALALAGALGAALALTTATESVVAGDFARAHAARYAAEAGLERAIAELPSIGDWNLALGGAVQSTFVDGPPSGTRTLADGRVLDLARVVTSANAAGAPWGTNNPVWRLFAYGPLDALLPGGVVRSPFYVVVMVADDPSETDGNPLVDGDAPCDAGETPPGCNPGSGAIAVRAEAFGPRGAHQIAHAIVERPRDGGTPLRTRAQVMGPLP